MSKIFNNLIGGEWVASAEVSRNINPSNNDDVIGEYSQADATQVDAAVSAAKAAAPAWSLSTPQQRHDCLKKISDEILNRRDELGQLLAREEGKTLPEAIGEVARAGQIFGFFAGESLRLAGQSRPPVCTTVDLHHRGGLRGDRSRAHQDL
jgi:aldehyde dehydrogenase (NAD+)